MLRWLLLVLIITFVAGLFLVNSASSVDETDLVAYWSFDKDDGKDVSDDSGNGHEGSVMDAEWAKEGRMGGAMTFDGVGAFVDVPTDPGLDPGEDDWTIELWLKRADIEGGWHKILTKYPCCNWNGYRIGFLDNNVHVIFGTGPAPDNVEFTSLARIEDMEWHHLALVVDRDDDATIYIDGEPDDNAMSVDHIGPVATDQNLEIGRCHWCDGGNSMGFSGILDEIKIWRAALSQDEIELAMSGKLGAAVSFENALTATWGKIKANGGGF